MSEIFAINPVAMDANSLVLLHMQYSISHHELLLPVAAPLPVYVQQAGAARVIG